MVRGGQDPVGRRTPGLHHGGQHGDCLEVARLLGRDLQGGILKAQTRRSEVPQDSVRESLEPVHDDTLGSPHVTVAVDADVDRLVELDPAARALEGPERAVVGERRW